MTGEEGSDQIGTTAHRDTCRGVAAPATQRAADLGQVACRRSGRARAAARGIEEDLLSLFEITQTTNTAPSDYAAFFGEVLSCSTVAVELIRQIRRVAGRTNIGRENREHVEAHCVEAEGQIFFAQQEFRHIVSIIAQAGKFTPPTDIPAGTPACCICQEDREAFAATGRVVLQHCGLPGARHALCGGCFVEWFLQRGESTCPVCRADYDAYFKPI